MSRRQCQRHISTIGSSNNASAARVDPGILLQTLETFNMVQHVFSAPVLVHPLHVAHTIARTTSHVWNEDRETIQCQVLDQGHREPCEIRPLLSLRPSVNIFDQRSRTLVTEFWGGEIESCRNLQSVKRCIAGIFAGRKILIRNAKDLFACETCCR